MKKILMDISKEVKTAVKKLLGNCMDDDDYVEDWGSDPVTVVDNEGTQLWMYYRTRQWALVSRSPDGQKLFKVDNQELKT